MPDYSELTLSTSRLQLRPLSHADAEALLVVHADGDVMRYTTIPPWKSLDQAYALIERDLKGMPAGRYLCLGIVPTCEGQVVGTCTLFGFNQASRRAEVGFVLGRSAWGKGYMSEALRALLDYGFSSLDLNRVEADTDPRNLAAAKMLERLGFAKEGHLRERWIVGDEKSDTALYGLLKGDWARPVSPVGKLPSGSG